MVGLEIVKDYYSFVNRYCNLHRPRLCEPSRHHAQDENPPLPHASKEGLVGMILEKKITRQNTYYKVCVPYEHYSIIHLMLILS